MDKQILKQGETEIPDGFDVVIKGIVFQAGVITKITNTKDKEGFYIQLIHGQTVIIAAIPSLTGYTVEVDERIKCVFMQD